MKATPTNNLRATCPSALQAMGAAGSAPLASSASFNVQFIGCWYKGDMYSHSCSNLVRVLNHTGRVNVGVTTSNCGCYASAQRYGITTEELVDQSCGVIKLPYAPPQPSRKHGTLKYLVVKVLHLNLLLETARGVLFFWHSRKATIIHFDQVLKAFGCVALFTLIFFARLWHKCVVVTVHEIDPFQKQHPRFNRLYGYCAQVIVHSQHMKQELASLGVHPDKIAVVHFGSVIPPLLKLERNQFIFFGGHNILKGKGYEELLAALRLIKEQGQTVRLLIYVGKGCNGLEEAVNLSREKGVTDMIVWKEFLYDQELAEAYQRSKACVIPYTSGSGRHPASCAMANATPVIATEAVDLPEYLGGSAIYTDGSARALADAMLTLNRDGERIDILGRQLRERALQEFNHERAAQRLVELYVDAALS